MFEIVIVGAGYAGLGCALRLGARARQHGLPLRIQLVSPRESVVERIRLHQLLAGQPLVERSLERQLAGSGVQVLRGSAEAIDLVERTVRVDGRAIRWDRLVLAAGSATDLQRVPGAAEHAVAVEPDSAAAMGRALSALPERSRVAVVGGGLTAIEVASEVAEAYPQLQVHLITGGCVAQEFAPPARAHIVRVLGERLGVQVHEEQRVLAVRKDHVETTSTQIPFDLCIWAAGFVAPPLGGQAGLQVNGAGQVLVDPMLHSVTDARVYVAGDMGAPVLPPGQPLPMGCKSAMPMGVHVAENIVQELRGDAPQAFDYALLFYCVSLGRRDGLIQWADDAGRLTGRMLTGRRAAWFKEFICRSTIWALALERRGVPGVVWKHTARRRNAVNEMERLNQ